MKAKNQHTIQNPLKQYPQPDFPAQVQKEPGLAKRMSPKPDHGEESYKGSGRLKDRKAIVTGGDSGIGRAAAIAFAREGADIMLNYLPEEEPDAKEVVELIKAEGRKVFTFPADLSKEENCVKLIEKAVKELGGLDLLAIVAGKQISIKDIKKLSTKQFDETFRVNVYAMFWLCKAALPYMPPGSTIINTTSVQSYSPSGHLLDYASTKGAITAFTQALAEQVIKKGIRVNAIAPGPIWTPLQPSHGQPPEKLPTFGKDNSTYGRPGQPAEVAPAYVFLASNESSYITGEVIGVTGGKPIA